MSFDLLNPLMLLGLAGILLPVLAHLLSKKTYDVVDWGAMQFLELGKDARRRIRLEDLLLLLLRMGLIALLALALSRPWASGGFLTKLVSKQSRDVVLVIDGSYSMGWEDGAATPHSAAVQWAHEFLEELHSGDAVALLDARDRVRPVIESPTRDFKLVRRALDHLPPPAGSSDLAEAVARAAQILCRTSNVARDVIVLTDGQARGWLADDQPLWERLDDLREQAAVKPRVWAVNVLNQDATKRPNFAIERIRLSRELTVAGFPVRIQTRIRYSGGESAVTRRVYLQIDGQRLSERTVSVRLQPEGEASVEFEHRFASVGQHLVRVFIDDDNLPGDNSSDAVVTVADALPVLLVDGDPGADPTRRETFFAKAALSATANETPWVRATVVDWDELGAGQLELVEAVVLGNAPRLTDVQVGVLKDFVARGGGLCVALGDRVDAQAYNDLLFESGLGILPASLVSIASDADAESRGTRIADGSLELPWTERFRSERGGSLTLARFSHWWNVKLAGRAPSGLEPEKSPRAGAEAKPESAQATPPTSGSEASKGREIGAVQVLARLDTGDPFLIARRYKRGHIILMTSSIDADWGTLPAKSDYVPFLHELIFRLATGAVARNVDVGVPLILPAPEDFDVEKCVFRGPGDTEFPAQRGGNELRRLVRLDDTRLPGLYTLHRKGNAQGKGQPATEERFVVNGDRGESDLTPLNEAEHAMLERNNRVRFLADREELQAEMFVDHSQTEFWHILLLVFLAILVSEIVLTRRLVRGGHKEAVGSGQ